MSNALSYYDTFLKDSLLLSPVLHVIHLPIRMQPVACWHFWPQMSNMQTLDKALE